LLQRAHHHWSRYGWRQFLLFAYQVTAVWVSVKLLVPGLRLLIDHNWMSNGWGDGRVDWGAAQLFLQGKSPYTPEGLKVLGLEAYGFGHPPTTPFWFIPLAPFSQVVMAQALALLSLLSLLIHVVISVDELRLPSRLITVLLLLAAIIGTPWMIEHFHVIQISEFIALAYLLAWYHLRNGRDAAAGACLGIACTLKFFPGLLVIYLALARRWRAVAAAIAFYLPVAIIMTWGYGVGSWRLFFSQQGHIAETWLGHIRNASIHGIVLRLLTPTCVTHADPSKAGTVLAAVAALLVLAFTYWVTRRELRRAGNLDLSFALFTLVSAFLNVWIWEHYRVLLILPLLIIARKIADDAGDAWRGRGDPLTRGRKVRRGVGVGAAAVAWIGTLCLLTDGVWDKEIAQRDYLNSGGLPVATRHALHVRLHLLEVQNWLPWILAMALLSYLLIVRARRMRPIGS
jgi:hypothetical protein